MATGAVRAVLFGHVTLIRDGQPVSLPRAQTRGLFALLALHAGRPLSHEVIIEALWGGAPPGSARSQVHASVSAIRRQFTSRGAGELLAGDRFGYRLALDDAAVDAGLLDQGLRLARGDLGAGRVDAAAARLRAILDRCAGEPLLDAAGAFVDAARSRLVDQRISAWELLADAELPAHPGTDHGRLAGLVDELTRVVAAHPLREQLRMRLMRALHLAGRQVDALRLYRDYRDLLAEREGLDPGPDIAQLELTILRGGPEPNTAAVPTAAVPTAAVPTAAVPTAAVPTAAVLTAATRAGAELAGTVPAEAVANAGLRAGAAPVPRQLPPAIADFTGRSDDLAVLDSLAVEGRIVTVSGTAGVGKTALVSHWAHRALDRFPDGQLYVNLRGFDREQPVDPLHAVLALLGALGLPGERLPVGLGPASAMYRSLTAGRRMLVLIDNAGTESQVRPLLPGGGAAVVLVTSRERLVGLTARDGARPMTLAPMRAEESAELVAAIVGRPRFTAEARAGAQLAALCAHLPLALRIAAAQLAAQPSRRIADQVAALSRGGRLAGLDIDGDAESSVRAALAISYQRLPVEAGQLFRMLGLAPGVDLTAEAAGALTGTGIALTAKALARLTRAHLVEETSPGRYALHDLLRDFAREQGVASDSEVERAAAVHRLDGFYLRHVDAAGRLLYPSILRLEVAGAGVSYRDGVDALAWVSAEHDNVVAAILHAAAHGHDELATRLVDSMRAHFWFGQRATPVWLPVALAGLAAAERWGDLRGLVAAELNLASAQLSAGRARESAAHCERAVRYARRAGWLDAERGALTNLAIAQVDLGRLRDAIQQQQAALELARRTGDPGTLAFQLLWLARTVHLTDGPSPAREPVAAALELARSVHASGLEASALRLLAQLCADAGDHDAAVAHARAALDLTPDRDPASLAEAHNTLAEVHLRRHEPARAVAEHRTALAMAKAAGSAYLQCESLMGLSADYAALADVPAADRHAAQALAIARELGFRALEGHALAALAAAHATGGDRVAADAAAESALRIHRETGSRHAQGRDLMLLGRLRAGEQAVVAFRQALALFEAIGAQADARSARHLADLPAR